jgi:hypothetical protein
MIRFTAIDTINFENDLEKDKFFQALVGKYLIFRDQCCDFVGKLIEQDVNRRWRDNFYLLGDVIYVPNLFNEYVNYFWLCDTERKAGNGILLFNTKEPIYFERLDIDILPIKQPYGILDDNEALAKKLLGNV